MYRWFASSRPRLTQPLRSRPAASRLHRALLQPEQGAELTLGDAAGSYQFDERAGLGRREGRDGRPGRAGREAVRLPRRWLPVARARTLRARHAEQLAEQAHQL